MKKIILSITIVILCIRVSGQLKIEPGASWVTLGNATLVMQDMDLVNNGLFSTGTGSIRFTGLQNSSVSGSGTIGFYMMDIAKTNNTKVILNKNLGINVAINFVSGQLDLNGNNISLSASGYISGETELNRITGNNGGYVEISQNIGTPNMSNPGNLGAFITSSSDVGVVTIRRGHTPQSGAGLSTSVNRYYSIAAQNNANLNATLRLKYFDAELNGQTEAGLVIYQSANAGTNWNNLSKTTNSTNANYVEKTGIASLALQTLSNNTLQQVGGVTGLVLTGQRKKATEVTLKWTSQTETNMNRYQVQRKLDSEPDFTDRAAVNTLAPGGNSIVPLNYQHTDPNAHTGSSHYRLKIIATDNSFTYSDVITIAGKTKGKGGGNNNLLVSTVDEEETLTGKPTNRFGNLTAGKITVGPNPNNGNFWFSVNGIEKEIIAILYTIDGKQIQQFRVVNQQQQKVNGIRSGMYLLKVPGFETQKIMVNSGGSGAPVQGQTITNNSKL